MLTLQQYKEGVGTDVCDEAAGAVVRAQTDRLQTEGDIAGPVGAVRLREGVACQADISTADL